MPHRLAMRIQHGLRFLSRVDFSRTVPPSGEGSYVIAL